MEQLLVNPDIKEHWSEFPASKSANYGKGRYGVSCVCSLLQKQGFKIQRMADFHPSYDLLCNGLRVEVKLSPLRAGRYWQFNIARKGVLNESEVDVYALRLENVPFAKSAITLFIPAPIGAQTITISFRSLMMRYGKFWNNYDLFRKEQL